MARFRIEYRHTTQHFQTRTEAKRTTASQTKSPKLGFNRKSKLHLPGKSASGRKCQSTPKDIGHSFLADADE
eukprot:scaffold4946_cov186-Amphora_coffeaeformis.AAC.2